MRTRLTASIRSLAVLPILLLAATIPPWAGADVRSDGWIEAVSPNLTLVTNVDERRAFGLLQSLEAERSMVMERFADRQANASLPTTIVLFADEPTYASFRLAGRDGQFFPTAYESLVILNGGSQRRPVELAASHEYLHALIAEGGHRLPLWMHEGLAEYFSTFRVRDDRVVVGMAVPGHRSLLRNRAFLPFEELTAVSGRSPSYHGESGGRFYAQAWLTVHYLMSDPDRAGRFRDLIEDAERAADPEVARSAIVGDTGETLDELLRRYLNLPTLPSFAFPLPVEGLPEALQARPLTAGELSYRLGVVALEQARWSESARRFAFARELFETAIALRPDDGDAHAGLARLEDVLDRPGPAQRSFERAVFLDALEARSYAHYAEFLLQREDSERQRSEDSPELDRAAQMLRRALDFEPRHDRLKARLDDLTNGSAAEPRPALGNRSNPRR